MPGFIKIEVFINETFIATDSVFINPNHIVGFSEVLYKGLGSVTAHKFTKFWTSDRREYCCPLDIVKFKALL